MDQRICQDCYFVPTFIRPGIDIQNLIVKDCKNIEAFYKLFNNDGLNYTPYFAKENSFVVNI